MSFRTSLNALDIIARIGTHPTEFDPSMPSDACCEFEYRFDRRFNLSDIIPRLVYVALRTPAMPGWLLCSAYAKLEW